MTRRRQWSILGALVAVYLIGLGVLAGIVSERLRFDTVRRGVLRQLDEVTQRARAHAMAWERDARRAPPPAAAPAAGVVEVSTVWGRHLDAVEAALSHGDVRAAERAWRDANAAAIRTRAWRPLVAVGDAALRIGSAAGERSAAASRAREAYMNALSRARADRSADGVLRVAESFHGLGDRRLVEQCLIIAERLGANPETEAMTRLRPLGHRAQDVRATPTIEP